LSGTALALSLGMQQKYINGKIQFLFLIGYALIFNISCGQKIYVDAKDETSSGGQSGKSAPTEPAPGGPSLAPKSFNENVMDAIAKMPKAGVYSLGGAQIPGVSATTETHPHFNVITRTPSNCTTATYSVFLKALSEEQTQQEIRLDRSHIESVTPQRGQSDGIGAWGWWNANGPGTARLVYKLNIGVNFRDPNYMYARPGDFMKIWWTSEVGKIERGHSVVFSGVKKDARGNITEVCYWSSNQGTDGFGFACKPASSLNNHLFSRINSAEKLAAGLEKMRATSGGLNKFKDLFLEQMLTRTSSHSEVDRMVGAQEAP
jgi:hypothetical protein